MHIFIYLLFLHSQSTKCFKIERKRYRFFVHRNKVKYWRKYRKWLVYLEEEIGENEWLIKEEGKYIPIWRENWGRK